MGKTLITLTFIGIFLGGCSSPTDEETIKTQQAAIAADASTIDGLNKQVASLQKDIDDQVAQHKVDIEYESDEVTRAQACKFIFPICPASLITQGRQLTGKIDGNGWFLWYVFVKFFLIIVFIAVFIALCVLIVAVIDWVYLHITVPKRHQIEEARELIKSAAESQKNQAAARSVFEWEESEAYERIDELNNRIARIQTYLKVKKLRLEKINEEITSKKVVEEAIQAFKTLK